MRAELERMIGRLPSEPGVYRFRDGRHRVLYVGRAATLRSRVASYWSHLGDRRHLVRMVAAVRAVEVVVCDSRHEAAWLERNLLERALPRWNRTPGGAEVPVLVRLDAGPVRPGLRVEHWTGRQGPDPLLFGPYLGGLQVRRAVSGLARTRPLAYTAARLSGSERAMAVEHGVTGGDRELLVDALTATLSGDGAAVEAVRTELRRARDRASAGQAYELAGRIEAELQGLDWVTAPQRVSLLEPVDCDIVGWADQVMVTFEMRAGRLSRWSQQRCDRSEAEAGLAATPPAWAGFARRNAELAAALAAC